MSNKFTYENVLKALEEAVAAKGEDYVYPKVGGGCAYTNPDKSPSCIVGHVVAKLTPEKIEPIFQKEYHLVREAGDDKEMIDSFSVYGLVRDYLADEEELMAPEGNPYKDTPLARALAAAQSKQDNGGTWGKALKEFKATYEYEMQFAK